ncbi:MAG TPA: tRNA 2-thiouridine(34) synthase MnmA [Candidatus Cloacimonadota bacterium]|nr:tRNA 2-thiouridine(34) synthase MnmA [Candidatus Cloacimonadota bacterium]
MIVALGLSGGLDSAIAAALLLEAGHEVIGLTMSIYDPQYPILQASGKGCFGPGEEANLEAAKSLAKRLGIPHYVIPLQEEFTRCVLSYYRKTYLDGLTPNPCARCNGQIKFGALKSKAWELGLEFDVFATGHYVRRRWNPELGLWQLLRARDSSKDQSYFLSLLSQDQLASVLFPLGEYTKAQVRDLAKARNWDFLLQRSESQDFISTQDHLLLFDPRQLIPGEIVDWTGKVLGEHKGLIHYTIGQRKGLGVSGMPEPVFVTKIDAPNNRLVLGTQEMLFGDSLIASQMNWLSISASELPSRAKAKIRQQHQPATCSIESVGPNSIKLSFDEPQLSITPGQIVALYEEDILLGAGIIELTL